MTKETQLFPPSPITYFTDSYYKPKSVLLNSARDDLNSIGLSFFNLFSPAMELPQKIDVHLDSTNKNTLTCSLSSIKNAGYASGNLLVDGMIKIYNKRIRNRCSGPLYP